MVKYKIIKELRLFFISLYDNNKIYSETVIALHIFPLNVYKINRQTY